MTDQTIPPCPVCGTVPPASGVVSYAVTPCKCLTSFEHYSEYAWEQACVHHMYRALRDLGIETVAQVKQLAEADKWCKGQNQLISEIEADKRRRAAEGIKPKSTAHLTNPTR